VKSFPKSVGSLIGGSAATVDGYIGANTFGTNSFILFIFTEYRLFGRRRGKYNVDAANIFRPTQDLVERRRGK
jgi:hypothetical protein